MIIRKEGEEAEKDDSVLYAPREDKSARQNWKDQKGFKAKAKYFFDYYLKITIIALAAVVLLVFFFRDTFRPKKETQLFVAILDGVVDTSDMENLETDFLRYFTIDEETQELRFDNGMNISSQGDTTSKQKFTTYLFAREIDVIIASESCFRNIAEGSCLPLSEQISADLYEANADRYCYAAEKDDEGHDIEGSEQVYGLYVTDILPVAPYCNEKLVVAIVGNASHPENAEAFIRYLLQ